MELQQFLARRVLEEISEFPKIDHESIRFVAGLDAAPKGDKIVGVAVLLDYKTGLMIKYAVAEKKPIIPYVPGLLAFREAPAYICALKKLGVKPDVIFVDGHGLSHPRGFGIATHIGMVLDTPSIGVAKKKLYGEEILVNGELYIKAHKRLVAKIMQHRGVKLYISMGYKVRLEDAVELTMRMLKPQYKLPLPTALADAISKKIARRIS